MEGKREKEMRTEEKRDEKRRVCNLIGRDDNPLVPYPACLQSGEMSGNEPFDRKANSLQE
ncbi:conserved hypothetical protein [Ricinus communis]|uniref:Uncharacterized protein n=1 Tax=Ricinus communis TaxID=3988 RepID=B9SZ86_RICCO|nr:conserved hypothetical protein [Ricinus communis]